MGRVKATPARRLCERIELVAYDSITSLHDMWKGVEAEGNGSVYQRYDWIKTCLETVDSDSNIQPYIVVGYHEKEPAFIFPLVIKGRFIKKLQWIGGSHSNYNMPMFSNYFLDNYSTRDINVLFNRILRMLPGVALVELCRQPTRWDGRPNPFMEVAHVRSPNPAFNMSLEGGLEGVLKRGNRKRKLKKFRSQERFCEKYGGYKLIVPNCEAEALYLIEVFKKQKALRFKKLGIKNVFESSQAECFLDSLAVQSLSDDPIVRLYGLEIDGEIRAILGGGISGRRFSGYFSSISDDEFTSMSPGELLLYLIVEDCAKRGYENLDLGAGDERYKRSWCSDHIDLFDTIVPVKALAYPICMIGTFKQVLKRRIRSSNMIWELVRRFRKAKGSLALKMDKK